jgi:SAM-dependent methyltransferase
MSQRFGLASEWVHRARRRFGRERARRFLARRERFVQERALMYLAWRGRLGYEPGLVPPFELLQTEGIDNLEEWFRGAEEWGMLLRVYGRLRDDSDVLEIGCGLGRVAFALRYVLSQQGAYHGFEICRDKVEFLRQKFSATYPNFHFHHDDVHNTDYNPTGTIRPEHYRFPYEDASFDLIYAASVFTHLLPAAAEQYMRESARVLRPQGRCVFSFCLLDCYRPGQPRPLGFNDPIFSVDQPYGDRGDDFAVSDPQNPEYISAYRLGLVERLAAQADLRLAQPPLPGVWSGSSPNWVGTQDVVVLVKSSAGPA